MGRMAQQFYLVCVSSYFLGMWNKQQLYVEDYGNFTNFEGDKARRVECA
jgi:hypothetical protein